MTPNPRPATARRWLLPVLAVAAVVVAAGLALFQPWKLWVDEVVDEALPTGIVAATVTTTPGGAVAAPTTPAPTVAAAPSTSATPAPSVAPAPAPTTAAPAAPSPAPPATAAPAPAPAEPSAPATEPPATTATTAPAPAAPAAEALPPAEPAPTSFRSKAHATAGTVRLLTLADGSRVLRIEDLDTDNGPDLKLVLSTDPDGYVGEGAVSLGTLKGNKGSQNYEIPADVDLSSLRSVVIWCKRFDVDFGVAALPGA